jgi:hypothetical protein
MTEPTIEAVLQRLEHLERASRRWKILGSIALAALGCVVFLGATRTTLVTISVTSMAS